MIPIRTLDSTGSGNGHQTLYLTFDDGPDPASTPKVLDLLDRLEVQATFFCIAQKAKKHPQIIRELGARGHTVGNHSLDHGYREFFRGSRALRMWIEQAEAQLQLISGQPTIGFRPPAGVRTPELHRALGELQMPLVLWSTRFYDAVFPWSQWRALRSLQNAKNGQIILLHDRQPPTKLPSFLEVLELYVRAAREKGYRFEAIRREQIKGKGN